MRRRNVEKCSITAEQLYNKKYQIMNHRNALHKVSCRLNNFSCIWESRESPLDHVISYPDIHYN